MTHRLLVLVLQQRLARCPLRQPARARSGLSRNSPVEPSAAARPALRAPLRRDFRVPQRRRELPRRGSCLHGGPGLIDPRVGRGRVAFGPPGRRGDVADRDRYDAVRVKDRERVFGYVLAETDHRVLVALVVVGPDVDVAGRSRIAQAFELTDDRIVVRPAAHQTVGFLNRGLEQVSGRVGAFGLKVWILLPAREILFDEHLVGRPAVAWWKSEVVVRVNPGDDAFRMILADGMRRDPESQGG